MVLAVFVLAAALPVSDRIDCPDCNGFGLALCVSNNAALVSTFVV